MSEGYGKGEPGAWPGPSHGLSAHTRSSSTSTRHHFFFYYLRATHFKNQNETTIPTNIAMVTIWVLCSSSEGTWSRLCLRHPEQCFDYKKVSRENSQRLSPACLKLSSPITLGWQKSNSASQSSYSLDHSPVEPQAHIKLRSR